jgi:crotonobetainyl-CoA:carnitine CoA-transferase CaiB-like acyl-CoA transferase
VTLTAQLLLAAMQAGLGDPVSSAPVLLTHHGSLPSPFAVSDLAQASLAAAGASLASLTAPDDRGRPASVIVDEELACAWFQRSIMPLGWEIPPVWDAIAGDYAAGDGWIKLHTNAPHHKQAALSVLGTAPDRDAVTRAVTSWEADELEAAVVAAGGAAAAMRSIDEWTRHPQGRAVAAEPLLRLERTAPISGDEWVFGRRQRPLAGLRVLDLTRVLAGPAATRLLAGWGADVLRIDPPDWDEPAIAPEMTLGKRCARLDLRTREGRDRLLELLGSADVLVHGYRPGALDGLDLGDEVRADTRPGLIDVGLDAYGWTGPWANRRGFDSLVQMSSGIADAGRTAARADRPVPLPVQALDHATGYLLAAAVLTGARLRRSEGTGSRWRTSLARVAELLIGAGRAGAPGATGTSDAPGAPGDRPRPRRPVGPVEHTSWGEARRLPAPLMVDGAPLHWSLPARRLGSDGPRWPRR